VWEGGTRGAAFVHGWGLGLRVRGTASTNLFHVADWVPTLLAATADNDNDDLSGSSSSSSSSSSNRRTWSPTGWQEGDGVDQWPTLVAASGAGVGPRAEVVYNINDVSGSAAIRDARYKLVRMGAAEATTGGWYGGVAGLRRGHSIVPGTTVLCDNGMKAKGPADPRAGSSNRTRMHQIRLMSPADASDAPADKTARNSCSLRTDGRADWCLFDLQQDPCERNNIAAANPSVVARLAARVQVYSSKAVPCLNNPATNVDARWWPAAHPAGDSPACRHCCTDYFI
jgi:hypothetical protein